MCGRTSTRTQYKDGNRRCQIEDRRIAILCFLSSILSQAEVMQESRDGNRKHKIKRSH
jgi:hypothetical protein